MDAPSQSSQCSCSLIPFPVGWELSFGQAAPMDVARRTRMLSLELPKHCAFSLTFLPPSRSLSGCSGGKIGNSLEQPCPPPPPTLTPASLLPSPRLPKSLREFMGGTFCLQSAVRCGVKEAP